MAPRSPPPPPPPSEVRLALGYLLRVAQAHATHVEDLKLLQGIAVDLARGGRLTRKQTARIREAQAELVRGHAAMGPLVDHDPRAIDSATATDAALKRRRHLRDRPAETALRKLAEAGQTFAETYDARAFELQSIDVFRAIKQTYTRVRDGLSTAEQEAEIEAAFRSADLRVTAAGIKALFRTQEKIRRAGGPSDCAKQTVGHVFGNSEGTMGQRIRHPAQTHAGITFFAFARLSNLLSVTEYVLRTVGWTEAEAIEFLALARKLYAKRPRSDRAYFFTTPTA